MAQLVPGDTGAGAGDLPWTVDTFNELLDPVSRPAPAPAPAAGAGFSPELGLIFSFRQLVLPFVTKLYVLQTFPRNIFMPQLIFGL